MPITRSLAEMIEAKKKIEQLVEQDLITIYNIVLKHNENVTVNSNGVYFDLKAISDETYAELMQMIGFTRTCK